jgi:PHP family Zn ribbon phosphoesterase
MRIIADLHIHSYFSRATSPKLKPPYLDLWARIKGLDLLGTGDCTHPLWLKELRETLDDAEPGFYTLKDSARAAFAASGVPDAALANSLPEPAKTRREISLWKCPRFVLTGEICTIYKRGDRTRKVHHLVILPDFKAAAAFQDALGKIANIRSDGRPILGIDSRDLLALLLDTDDRAMLIPAHIWTPWFSVLGAKSGFDSIEECYGELAAYIPAIETGLSSDPPMNWAVGFLDRFSIISNSDAHSPEKLGREATVFEMNGDYASLSAALRPGSPETAGSVAGSPEPDPAQALAPTPAPMQAPTPTIVETIEFFPQEGKYHYDGHRNCGVGISPRDAAALDGICPVCHKPLTPGVLGRVLKLADKAASENVLCPKEPERNGGGSGRNRRPYRSLIPLKEILGELLQTGVNSKKVTAVYTALIEQGGPELGILMDLSLTDIKRFSLPGLAITNANADAETLSLAINRMRCGTAAIVPGYDGKYGYIRVGSDPQ